MINKGEKLRSVLTIGGTDPIGGSGVTLDARVISDLGCHPLTVISSTIAQNSGRVISADPVSGKLFSQQLAAIFEVTTPDIIKIGLLHTTEQVNILCALLTSFRGPIIYDPVLVTSSGFSFCDHGFLDAVRDRLLPLLSLITPNIPEAQALLAIERPDSLQSVADFQQTAAQSLQKMGPRGVLLKGGHSADESKSADFWYEGDQKFWLVQDRLPWSMRGTGCALSSAIAAYACQTLDLAEAAVLANTYVHAAIRTSRHMDQREERSHSRLFHRHHQLPDQASDFPVLCNDPENASEQLHFATCDAAKMAVYPIVDRADLVAELAREGVQTIQLRIKDLTGSDLIEELRRGQDYARAYGIQLFINDYWREAIELNAFGVHHPSLVEGFNRQRRIIFRRLWIFHSFEYWADVLAAYSNVARASVTRESCSRTFHPCSELC